MSSSYKRIQSNSIQYGESFVISADTEEETIGNLSSQKKGLQQEIDKKRSELDELKDSLKGLFQQKDHIIEDAKKAGEEIKAKAILKAEESIAQANEQKDNIINEAKAQGHKQGFEVGYNEGMEKFSFDYQKHLSALNALVNASFEVKNEIVFSAEKEILELALMIAEKVVRVKFTEDINCLKNMTQTAISLLKEKENVKIVVNPKLVKYAEEISPKLVEEIEGLEQIKIIKDKSVSDDGVVVESIESRIDARISTQLEVLARTLLIDKKINEPISDDIEEKIKVKIDKVQANE